jgi:hypothetical protein
VGKLAGKIELFLLELNISDGFKCAFFGGKMYVLDKLKWDFLES